MTTLQLFAAAAVGIVLCWPVGRAAAPAAVPAWADVGPAARRSVTVAMASTTASESANPAVRS